MLERPATRRAVVALEAKSRCESNLRSPTPDRLRALSDRLFERVDGLPDGRARPPTAEDHLGGFADRRRCPGVLDRFGDDGCELVAGLEVGHGGGQPDINSARVEDLQRIIHIGPERATQIQNLRPFSSVDALTWVNRIAEGRLRDIKEEGVACVG